MNINGKATWLIRLLGLPPINRKHLKTISKTSELRNAYLHYKWKPSETEEKTEDEHLLSIKGMIRYLRAYETKIEFQGKKNLINNTINNK